MKYIERFGVYLGKALLNVKMISDSVYLLNNHRDDLANAITVDLSMIGI